MSTGYFIYEDIIDRVDYSVFYKGIISCALYSYVDFLGII